MIALLAPSLGISLKCSTSRAPDCLVQAPIDRDSVLLRERTDKGFGAPGCGDEFGENRRCDYQAAAIESRVQRCLRSLAEDGIIVP